MKHLIYIICLAVASCSHPKETTDLESLKRAQSERDRRVSIFSPAELTRCDYGTFAAYLEAYSTANLRVAELEKPDGKWNRHFEPCYPDEKRSQSETTADEYLSVLHLADARGDMSIPERMDAYARPLGWVTGAGPVGVTSIGQFVPVITKMINSREATGIPNPFEGFRGHQLASYAWLHSKVFGGLSFVGVAALKKLHDDTQENPFFAALYHRFHDGDQEEAFALLDSFHDCSKWWGSCHDTVLYAMTVAVLEGR